MKNAYISQKLQDAASVFSPKFDIYEELDKLHNKLRLIRLDKESVNLEWWKETKKRVLDCAAQLDSQSLKLTSDPDRNRIELLKRHYLSESLKMLINIVEKSLVEEPQVIQRINELTEITKQTKPQ